ncbi:MAG TPA: hypothetical protein VGV87_24180 [Blastocatellia bacterium]|nr:hypothetical protein [Blastocatellia bacterium]
MNLEQIATQLDVLEVRYQDWRKPINDVIEKSMQRVNRDGYTLADSQREIKEIFNTQHAIYDPVREESAFYEEVCLVLLNGTAKERDQLRALVSSKPGVQACLRSYASDSVRRLQLSNNIQLLRIALAALSIDNCSSDYRDVLTALAEIYVAAEKVGIDPEPHFKYVASLSSNQRPRGGQTSVAEILDHFAEYAILKERRARPE